jgi:ankyrin repeat protein
MDSLMGQPTVGDVKEALKNLPKGSRGLDETYDNAMQRIDDQQPKNRHLARKILAWVVYARTALSRWEIRDALAVRPNTAHLDNDFRPELEVIDSLCAGLIAVDDNSDVVRLVHYTTQEYFTQKNFFPDAHTALAEACITYLTFDDFATGPYLHQGAFQERFREHRLYEYAAMHWSSHYIEQDQSYRKDARSVLNFLEDDTKVSASFQVNLYYNEIDTFDRRLEVQGVHLAAFMGLRDLLVTLIKAGKSPISQDNKGRTPLWFAAWNGKADIVQLLLSVYNIGSTTVGSEYNRALALAAERGHTAVVKLLLRRKDFEPAVLVYLDFHGGKYIEKTTQPLLEAVEGGHLETVQALLEDYRVDPNVENEKYKTALHISIEGDHSPVSRLLLDDSRFNPWVRDNDGRYPLLLAAMYCQFDTFQYLLNDEQTTKIGLDSIDTHIEDNNGRTLLWWASYGGDLNIVNLLLSKCTVDANRQDYDGRTPVAEAARSGSTQVLEVLLSKCKGNPNIADDTGREPLSIAAVEGHLDAVSLLITNYGVNPDAQDNSGRTALSYVAEKGKAQVADYLLGHGVNPDSKDALNRTPLSYAVNKGHVEIVEKLLENRADANAKDSNGMTILKYAWRNREVLEPLLMRGHAKPDEFTLDILDDEFGRQSEVYKFVKAKMDAIRDTEVGATDSEASTLAQDDGSVNINIVNMSLN